MRCHVFAATSQLPEAATALPANTSLVGPEAFLVSPLGLPCPNLSSFFPPRPRPVAPLPMVQLGC